MSRFLSIIGCALIVALTGSATDGVAGARTAPTLADAVPSQVPSSVDLVEATSRDVDLDLVDERLRALVDGGRPAGVTVEDGMARVEVLHLGDEPGVRSLVERLGGTIDGAVPGALLEGEVPVESLERLESSPLVGEVRVPVPVNEPVAVTAAGAGAVGEQLGVTNADDWQEIAGFTGTGVQVAIVDQFGAEAWSAAEAAGEVPTPVGTFCRREAQSCDVFAGTEAHGVAVAEVIHDMAPGADLYLVDVGTTADLQAAVDWLAGQGVDIVSRSMTSPYDGPGRGASPIDQVMTSAVNAGMVWFQAVGNNAGVEGVHPGSYYRWTHADADNDGFLEFAPGQELLAFECGYQIGLRWSDFFTTGRSDYDMLVFDPAGFPDDPPIAVSIRDQTAGGNPIERTEECVPGINYLAVGRFSAGAQADGDVLEFAMNGTGLGLWQNEFSASTPAADYWAPDPGVVVVGATEPPGSGVIASYSAQGPVGVSDLRPDLVAPACLASTVLAPDCFSGTSAATATVAGAAALIVEAERVRPGARRLVDWILRAAVVRADGVSPNQVFGRGEFVLPTELPDAQVRAGRTGAFIGDNRYGEPAGQYALRDVRRGRTTRFTVRVVNDGITPDRYRISGTAPSIKFRVRYLVDGIDRTPEVIGGTLQTLELAPGEHSDITVTVLVRRSARWGERLLRLVTATSVTDLARSDTVGFSVTAR